ncbi:hypothetical protein PF327_06745 [Sulfurovum sp. XTW-4]|uniref:Bll5565 protein n=1 Tax=Sulfurovum xiamenensis TaxID=3019066 RepID=A0ABT7QS31_9BACT|nr:hypothetical protein [Sulfurovum xiamenensis]MDM5263892.1 hypothetical protein [Sulfurovum xiamenensis]
MLSAIQHKLILLLQLLLVVTYIIFEELIWEGIAKPIYEAIHALKILQRIEVKLEHLNPSMILVIFILLFAIVEAFGIYAGMLFVSGQMLLGLVLYISKIPIAAFTFWLFRITEDKLMQFGWFKWVYEWIMKVIDWIKSSEMHQKTMAYLLQIKMRIKAFKEKYFSGKSLFIEKIKQLYKTLKALLRK